MSTPIPEDWRRQVARILSSGSLDRILIRRRVQEDFCALFPGAFRLELLDCLRTALETDGLEGRPVIGMKEPGTIYEFIFHYRQTPIYSKINLCPDGSVVIVYSAHRPNKGDTL